MKTVQECDVGCKVYSSHNDTKILTMNFTFK